MKRFPLALALIFVVNIIISGCISPRSYLDPSTPKVSYEDVKRRNEPLKLKLSTEFQRNGEHYEKADLTLKDNSERILRGTGVIIPSAEAIDGEIIIVCNNIADLGTAAGKGFGTGLTFGAVGSTVTDAYEMSLTIKLNDGKVYNRKEIKHALHTAIGNTSVPDGVETVPLNVGFSKVLEQMLLRVLKEMQEGGEISYSASELDWWYSTTPTIAEILYFL
jgi:hypothetical protein